MFGLQAMPTAAAVAAAAATAKIQALDAVATNLGLVRFCKIPLFFSVQNFSSLVFLLFHFNCWRLFSRIQLTFLAIQRLLLPHPRVLDWVDLVLLHQRTSLLREWSSSSNKLLFPQSACRSPNLFSHRKYWLSHHKLCRLLSSRLLLPRPLCRRPKPLPKSTSKPKQSNKKNYSESWWTAR